MIGRNILKGISFDWSACVTLAAGELLLPLQQQWLQTRVEEM